MSDSPSAPGFTVEAELNYLKPMAERPHTYARAQREEATQRVAFFIGPTAECQSRYLR
jgi:acyl-coenzyme A thioesterase PaaI-like protein